MKIFDYAERRRKRYNHCQQECTSFPDCLAAVPILKHKVLSQHQVIILPSHQATFGEINIASIKTHDGCHQIVLVESSTCISQSENMDLKCDRHNEPLSHHPTSTKKIIKNIISNTNM